MAHDFAHAAFSRRNTFAAAAVAAMAATLIAACAGDTTGVGTGSSQIAFSATASPASNSSLSTAPITVGGHTLVLTSLTLTVARIELKRAPTDACPGDNDNDDDHPNQTPSTADCGELKVGPVTVALPLDGSLVTLPANTIPAGTFRGFDVRVSQVEIMGTFDTKPFDVVLPVHANIENTLSTPLVVTATTPFTFTVNLTTAGWFVNSDGSLIAPSELTLTPSLLARVRANVLASFHAFEDDNHDGRDDHEGHDGHGN